MTIAPALNRIGDFAAFLGEPFDEAMTYAALRKAESIGRPISSKDWITEMEARTGLTLAAQKRGPVPKKLNPALLPIEKASFHHVGDSP